MLPYLAATNRSNYTKLLRWILQEYDNLPAAVKKQFMEGGFAVRTSTESVVGCAHPDYIIETYGVENFKSVEGKLILWFPTYFVDCRNGVQFNFIVVFQG